MTNPLKSKESTAWTAILAGCLWVTALQASAQDATFGGEEPFGQLGIRGSINEIQGDATPEGNQEVSEGSLELGRIVSNTPVRPVQPQGPVGTSAEDANGATRSNRAVDPVQTGTALLPDEDPFAQEGGRIGTTGVRMSLEQSIGYSSNVSQIAGGDAGAFSQTDAALNFSSDWSRHSWQTNINGSYRRPFDSDAVDDIAFSADTALRLDMIDGFSLTAAGNYSAITEEFTSTTLVPGAVDTPLTQSYGGSLELERTGQRLQFSLRGSLERTVYEDVDLGGGLVQSQEDQNNDLYSIGVRVGYETSPALTPFVEGIYSIREYDLEIDRNGNRRDSNIMELRAGVEVDLGEKAQGEIAIGYVTEQFDDPLLEDLDGFTVNGNLDWSPERDTVVSLTLGTQTNNSIAANDNGNLIYNARLGVARQVNDRLSMDAFAGVQVETNDDRNTTVDVGVGVQYWVNRFMALTGDVEYSSFSSDAPNADFDEVSARVGVRLQR